MYLRTIKGKKKTYLVIVKGYRVGKKVKQKVLLNLGAIDELNKEHMMDFGKKLLSYFGGEVKMIAGESLTEERRVNWGTPAIIQKLWKEYRLSKIFEELMAGRKLEYNLEGSFN
jgi:hypothetical protein